MNVRSNKKQEIRFTITEDDIIGGGEVLILIAYAIKEDDNMWGFPAPQIVNPELYLKNKEKYDAKVMEFRNSCK